MLALFRTNQVYTNLLLILYALVLRLPDFWLGQLLWWQWLCGAVGVAVVGMFVNGFAYTGDTSRTVTQFPGLFVVLLWGTLAGPQGTGGVLIGLLLLTLVLRSVASAYKLQEPSVVYFNAGLYLGMASLFVPAFLFFWLFLVIAIGVVGRLSVRAILQATVGILVVLFVGGSWYYFRGELPRAVAHYREGIAFAGVPGGWPTERVAFWTFPLLTVVALFWQGGISRLINIRGKKMVSLLYWMMLLTLPVVLFGARWEPRDWLPLALPTGALIGLGFATLPPRRADLFHFLLFSAAVASGLVAAYF